MRQAIKLVAAVALAGLVAGCTSGNSGIEPPFTSANLNNDKVQLGVGVATYYGGAGTVTNGLNVVATFRQPNGLSATLVNTPSLSGPFAVPAGWPGTTSNYNGGCTPNVDAGTSSLTATQQTLPGHTPTCTTFGQTGGVYEYGFAPDNATTAGGAVIDYYPQPLCPSEPLFAPPCDAFAVAPAATSGASSQVQFIGGPPAYPNVRTPNYTAAFLGYTQGWTVFPIAPVAGSYNLSILVASGNHPSVTLTAPTATLSSTGGLPAYAVGPTFVEDGAGGGTASCTSPAGVTETIIDVQDATAGTFFTYETASGGAVTGTFAADLGPENSSNPTSPTLNAGDTYTVQCIGVDYPAFEAGPPGNTSETPAITGTNGQSDITLSPITVLTYGTGGGGGVAKVHKLFAHRFGRR